MTQLLTIASNKRLHVRLQQVIQRLAPYWILSIIVLASYGLYVREQERDTVEQLEASFNEQQAIQVGLASRSLEDHFNTQLNQIDIVATSLNGTDVNEVASQSLDEVLIPSLLNDRRDEYLAWGFWATGSLEAVIHLSSDFPNHNNDDDLAKHERAGQLLASWFEQYQDEVLEGYYPYVTPIMATPENQLYGVLYPILDTNDRTTVVAIIGVAIDFSIPLELYVVPVRSGEYGAAWVQDHNGVVIYDHESEIIGQNVADLHVNYATVQDLDKGFLSESIGRGEYTFTVERGGDVRRKLVAWDTVDLFNQRMTLALSAPDTEISALLGTSRLRNQVVGILLVAVFVVGGGFIFYFQQGAMRQLVNERTAELATERELLKEQVQEREWAENQVRQANDLLEQRVAARTAELRAANERLKDLDRLKTKFVMDVSHELRTPIASLLLNIDLLEKDSPDRQAGYLEKIKLQANHVATMVKDILNLSKMEQETLYKREVLQLNEIVEQAIGVHKPLASAKALAVSFDGQKNLPLICGSKILLIQAVTNLLANAIHYTTIGEIRMETTFSDGKVGLFVKDTGRGIDEEDLPYVFDRFYRGKAVSQSSVPGAGLGLDQVKEIVERFEGTIEVTSKVGKGSEFRVWFPCISRESECN